MNQSRSHSPSASSVFNSRSFSRTAGGRDDSGGSAILVGLDRGIGSAKKSGKFRHSLGEANVTALYCFRAHSPLAKIEKVTNVTWHARRHFPSVQHDHNCLKIYFSGITHKRHSYDFIKIFWLIDVAYWKFQFQARENEHDNTQTICVLRDWKSLSRNVADGIFFLAQYFSLEITTEEISVLETMVLSVANKQLFFWWIPF